MKLSRKKRKAKQKKFQEMFRQLANHRKLKEVERSLDGTTGIIFGTHIIHRCYPDDK